MTASPDDILATMQRWLAGEPVWPYARIIDAWGPRFEMYRKRWAREAHELLAQADRDGKIEFPKQHSDAEIRAYVDDVAVLFHLRYTWISRYGFAIPCAELLDEMAQDECVVEIGAGSGYMTALMRHRGVNAVGSDLGLQPAMINTMVRAGGGDHPLWFDVGRYDPHQHHLQGKRMIRGHPKATIFCSWPSLHRTWFRQALKAMRVGQKIVIIREDACAEDSAWQYLSDCFDELRTIDIPTFEHMNDYAQVCVKKRQRAKSHALR